MWLSLAGPRFVRARASRILCSRSGLLCLGMRFGLLERSAKQARESRSAPGASLQGASQRCAVPGATPQMPGASLIERPPSIN